MVAIGLEELGAQEFVEGKFFDGEVYIDEGKKTYRDLNFKRFNLITILKVLLSRISRASIAQANGLNVKGNFSGDGLQNGGVLVVTKGGTRVLLNHHEEVPGDHATNEEILSVLGIDVVSPHNPKILNHQRELEERPDCKEECAIP